MAPTVETATALAKKLGHAVSQNDVNESAVAQPPRPPLANMSGCGQSGILTNAPQTPSTFPPPTESQKRC
jgi:hypothetical protein